jgi:hypothetical protein
MEGLFPGSVSYKIAQGVENTPVWVIGGDIRLRKMLLAVDGSENCCRAVDYVGTFAAATGAEVTLFSVVRDFKLQLLDVFLTGNDLSRLEWEGHEFRLNINCEAKPVQVTLSRKQVKGTMAPSL